MTTLDVKYKAGAGATDGFVRIDRKFVTIVGGRGRIDVSDEADHGVSMSVGGPSGTTLDYEIKQDEFTLVKGKLTISHGQTEGLVSGKFKLKSAS